MNSLGSLSISILSISSSGMLKAELFNLRFQLATGQLDNPLRIKTVRKDIARVKTIVKERELGIGKEV